MKSILLISSLLATLAPQLAAQSPKHFWHTVPTTAHASTIWSLWTDVGNWHLWDDGLQSASLEGGFEMGAKGELVSDKGRKVKFKVVEYVEGERYAIKMGLPLGSFTVRRYMEERDGVLHISHEGEFTGLSKGLFGRMLGRDYMKMLPPVVEKVRDIAEGKGNGQP